MLPRHLKGFAFSSLKTLALIFIVLTFWLIAMVYYQNSSMESESEEKQKLRSLQESFEALKNKAKISESALKIWDEKAKKKHSDRSGLKVKEVKVLLEDLRKANNVNNLVITLSTPELRSDFQDAKYASIVYSDVSLTFSVFNDVNAMRFINRFINEIPGQARVKTLNLTAVPKVDDTLLADIAAGKFFDVVNVKVDILWQDIVDKNHILQPDKNSNTAGTPNQTRGGYAASK